MEESRDLAKGFSKRDKSLLSSLGQELTDTLKSPDPPTKDANVWKRVIKLKSEIKKKLAHNTSETRETGGGPFTKHILTESEEAIVRICGMTRAVEGAPRISLDQIQEPGDELSDEIPMISSKREPKAIEKGTESFERTTT
ncbi:uncharacterized protein LOC118736060 [Rhagoletis pomonella]|uniref:uncharacterized protein LOC118736060 n=1 Tax=Rhagoletis pomonella TaxID=28610 RepID=UPI0017808CFC|nr:uncharacterized protein LOC118736060 [Rhagoletis pomonella]